MLPGMGKSIETTKAAGKSPLVEESGNRLSMTIDKFAMGNSQSSRRKA
jgi:hypothetical protein